MNAERLHAALTLIQDSYIHSKTLENFQGLSTALNQYAASPTDATALEYKNFRNKLLTLLSECESNNAHPTIRMIFDQIGATPNIGIGLLRRLELISVNENLTPISAATEIQKLMADVQKFSKKIDATISRLEALNIDVDDLQQGEFELGISMPRKTIGQSLEALSNEFKNIEKFMKTFNETAYEVQEQIDVRLIGSSEEWQIFIHIGGSGGTISGTQVAIGSAVLIGIGKIAKMIAEAIGWVVKLYKDTLEIRKLKQAMKISLPAKKAKEVEKILDPDEIEKERLTEFAKSLVDNYYKKNDSGRKNELKIAVREALIYIASRVDKGVTFEVNHKPPIGPTAPKEPTALPEDKTKEMQDEHKKAIKKYKEDDAKYKKAMEERQEILETIKSAKESAPAFIELERSDEPIFKISLPENKHDKDDDKVKGKS